MKKLLVLLLLIFATPAMAGGFFAGQPDMAVPGAIGGTTPAAGTFTTLTANTNPVTLPGGAKMFTYYASVGATTGTFNLPAITTSAHGILIAGANLYSATFRTDNAGTVQLLDSDAGGIIVANADTAAKLAIGDAAATDIIPITNRTADALVIMVILFYN